MSVYVMGYGDDDTEAEVNWAVALQLVEYAVMGS